MIPASTHAETKKLGLLCHAVAICERLLSPLQIADDEPLKETQQRHIRITSYGLHRHLTRCPVWDVCHRETLLEPRGMLHLCEMPFRPGQARCQVIISQLSVAVARLQAYYYRMLRPPIRYQQPLFHYYYPPARSYPTPEWSHQRAPSREPRRLPCASEQAQAWAGRDLICIHLQGTNRSPS